MVCSRESEPEVELVEQEIEENAEANYKKDVTALISRIKAAKERNKEKVKKVVNLIDQDDLTRCAERGR